MGRDFLSDSLGGIGLGVGGYHRGRARIEQHGLMLHGWLKTGLPVFQKR